MSKNNITEQTLQDWPTIAKMHKEVSKIKVQAHSDYIVDEINDYGLDIDVVVESKDSMDRAFIFTVIAGIHTPDSAP